MPNMQERLEIAIERTETDSSLFHNMVHGTDTQTVPTEGGEVPTMAKALKDVRDELYGQASSLVNMAQAAADDAANSVLLAQAEVQNAKAEVQNAKAEVVNTRQEGQRAKEELETVGANYVALAQAEVQNAQAEVANAQLEVQKAKNEVENAKAEVLNAKAEVVNAQTEVANAHTEFLNAQGEVAKAAQEVVKAKAEVINAQTEVANAQAEVQNAKDEVQNAKDEVVKAKAEVTNAKAEVQNAKAEVTKAQIWAEGTDSQVEAQGGTHSCREWVMLARQATIGSFPFTYNGIATANQTILPLDHDKAISSSDQILTVIVENTALLPENYGMSADGKSVVLANPLAAGERWCVKTLYDMQSMGGIIDCVVYEVESS